MSTKVYVAYRTKKDIFAVLPSICVKARKNVEAALHKFRTTLIKDYLKQETAIKKICAIQEHPDEHSVPQIMYRFYDAVQREKPKTNQAKIRCLHIEAHDYICRRYGEQLASFERCFFHLDVSISVRKYLGYYYLIPHTNGVLRDVLKFLSKEFEDYSYWDNADRPRISQKEWDRRGKIWEALDENWHVALHLDIVCYDSFYLLSPAGK